MPSPLKSIPRVEAQGRIRVKEASEFLAAFEHAYNSLTVFEQTIGRALRLNRRYPPWEWWPTPLRFLPPVCDWPPTSREIASLVPSRDKLILHTVSLGSPGVWEFFGKLNPLEVIRVYLNDRHERRQDREYREAAEAEKLTLENRLLTVRVISEVIASAKEVGATEEDLAPLKNELISEGLRVLDRYQDRGIITVATMVELPPAEDSEPGE